ncbi:MAG: hypothetical protein RIR00_1304 [Pseudomonadota bacterium]|jgi:hypothetical protein
MRPALRVLSLLAGLGGLLSVLLLQGENPAARQRLAQNRALVAQLGLTDLALFTEARYTRHPSQADYHAPFQDHPSALEHFPSGALMPPPAHLRAPALAAAPVTASPGKTAHAPLPLAGKTTGAD